MTLTDEQNDYIFEIYESSNRCSRIAVELFKQKYDFIITQCTIRNRWKERGLEIQAKGGYRNESKRKSHSPLYNSSNNPNSKYLKSRAKAKHLN